MPADSIPEELREQVAAWRDPNSLSNRAFAVTDPGEIVFDSLEVQAAELLSSNGIGTAHALAGMHAAPIGEVDGVRLLTPEAVAAATAEQADRRGEVMLVPSRFGAGYMLPTEATRMTGPNALGHTGRGGSLAFADPGHGVASGYAMNPRHRRYRRCACGFAGERGARVADVVRNRIPAPLLSTSRVSHVTGAGVAGPAG